MPVERSRSEVWEVHGVSGANPLPLFLECLDHGQQKRTLPSWSDSAHLSLPIIYPYPLLPIFNGHCSTVYKMTSAGRQRRKVCSDL